MSPDEPGTEHTWTARAVQPVVALWVAAVFVAFIALSHFVFHSDDAVGALFLTAIGSLAGMAPGVLRKVEYRITPSGVQKRTRAREMREFQDVFSWDDLSHWIPTASGFKFYRKARDRRPVRRFLRVHVLAGGSGEVRVEPADRARVWEMLGRTGIPASKPPRPGRLRSD